MLADFRTQLVDADRVLSVADLTYLRTMLIQRRQFLL